MFTLLLRIGAPIQSWGYDSLFDRRGTDSSPTKSGIIGMIAAAMGRRRDDSIEELADLRFGVRIDCQGERMTDYQITDMGAKLNANLSYRSYLCDALFLVGLESDSCEKLEQIAEALECPVFPLFLGRRSCPPTLPLVLGVRALVLEEALYEEDWLLPEWKRPSQFRFSEEVYLRIIVEDSQGETLKKDNPKSYSSFQRTYAYRAVSEKKPKVLKNPLSLSDTDHDPMAELR